MNTDGTYPTIAEALRVPRAQREDKVLVRYIKPGTYEWVTEFEVDELNVNGFEDEYELVEVAPGE